MLSTCLYFAHLTLLAENDDVVRLKILFVVAKSKVSTGTNTSVGLTIEIHSVCITVIGGLKAFASAK